MTNPTTHNTTTTTTTSTQKPSAMDAIKDKASNLVDKVTGRHHTHGSDDNTAGGVRHDTIIHPNDNTGVHTTGHSGAAGLGTNPNNMNNNNNNNNNTNATAGSTVLPAGANPSSHLADNHGSVHNNTHQQALDQQNLNQHHSGPMHTGAAMAGAAVPHNTSVDRAAYQQAAPGQHAIPAGPTGTSNVPTYSQIVPPTAAGVAPLAQAAEVHDGKDHDKHSFFGGHKDHQDHGLGAHQQVQNTAAGGVVPMNTNNTTGVPMQQQRPGAGAVPVQSMNNTVPAMGAPGTTTAAGTHVPGEYHTSQSTTAKNPAGSDPNRPYL